MTAESHPDRAPKKFEHRFEGTRRDFLQAAGAPIALALAGVVGCSSGQPTLSEGERHLQFWRERYDMSWKEALYLQTERDRLSKRLEAVKPGQEFPGDLLQEIADFNGRVERGYNIDMIPLFGREKPKEMPAELDFKPLPKIEPIRIQK